VAARASGCFFGRAFGSGSAAPTDRAQALAGHLRAFALPILLPPKYRPLRAREVCSTDCLAPAACAHEAGEPIVTGVKGR
jgi:hypothetical protein